MHIVYVSDGSRASLTSFRLVSGDAKTAGKCNFEEVSINDLPILSLIKTLFLQKSLFQQAPDFIFVLKSYTFSCLVAR